MINANIIPGATDAQIADWIEERLRRALDQADGTVAIALPGGATPFPILEQLVMRDCDWHRVTVTPTDDRFVPEDHPASNTGKLRALFDPLGAQTRSLSHVARADGQADIPRFALTWLGMGADGHIASLFPSTDPRADDTHWLRRLRPDPLPPEAPFDRITLTIPALLCCENLLLVIRGPDKRAVFETALACEHDLPIARLLRAVRPGQPVTVFV